MFWAAMFATSESHAAQKPTWQESRPEIRNGVVRPARADGYPVVVVVVVVVAPAGPLGPSSVVRPGIVTSWPKNVQVVSS